METGPASVNSNNQFVCYGEKLGTRITLGGVPSQARLVTGLPCCAAGAAAAQAAHVRPRDLRIPGNRRRLRHKWCRSESGAPLRHRSP